MKFINYIDDSDSTLFVTINENGETSTIVNRFVFSGFSNGIHPYHRKRINRIVDMFKSKGLILNVAEVSTADKMSINGDDEDYLTYDTLKLPSNKELISEDGNCYTLFQDTEMGRGWACFIKNKSISLQDHRDNILDKIEKVEFIKSYGIDYDIIKVDNINDIIKVDNINDI